MIDRLAPAKRPRGLPRWRQRWRFLLFLHWPVPPARIRPLVPGRLELDLHDGAAWIGLVAFALEGVRPAVAPETLALDFLEIHVRTYVHREGRDPGVFLLSIDTSSRLQVATARVLGLPSFQAEMQIELSSGMIAFQSARVGPQQPTLFARYQVGRALGPALPGSRDHFLVERYLRYSARGGAVRVEPVHHTPYPLSAVQLVDLGQDLTTAAGLAGFDDPALVHYASGVDVDVFRMRRVK